MMLPANVPNSANATSPHGIPVPFSKYAFFPTLPSIVRLHTEGRS
jgi:hypothetical protein